ncbi:MAG: AraC family transcriptional regulator [Oscillospiraceae bacterium]|nr:AraC family transcriptional regulator [Oscillospiraceae bacterium]
MNERIEAVRRMQRYISGHLDEVITPADLAAASLFSPWYARRLFEQYTGMSPAKYIRRLKLSRSALRLRDETCKVLDVAMDLGFGSVDGYQRAFRAEFGLNPKEYANHPVPISLFVPYLIKSKKDERSNHMETMRTVFIQVVNKPARKVIVKRGVKADNYWDYSAEVGCDVWGLLTSIPTISGEPVCLWLPEHLRSPKENVYVQGAEVSTEYDGVVPDGFEVIELPAAQYLMFQGEPFAEEDYGKAIQEIWDAEGKYDPSVIGYAWDNSNPKIQLEPVGARGYIELVAVKKTAE